MHIETRQENNALVVQILEKRLTASGVPDFKQALRAALKDPVPLLIIDMSAVEFVDSSGLGALVSVLRMLGGQNDLRLAGVKGAVRELFKLTRMDRAFKLFDSVTDALAGS